ncbi:MAG: two-component system sensor histidine kinase RppB [Oscillatoria sp. PMC 1051.18]|nr:two-component system sensor histidine kinase RppB [Oscillatoria sp. PMC 1050.18]MEC5032261.1 two-component system sensor histidine kinase RppB [Oscillatoria sp. PMC 1051.18]
MKQNRLFQKTRCRLAVWYAGVMGVILSVFGLGVYEAIAHAHRITIDRELQSVASRLENSLEMILTQPGTLTPTATRFLPDICIVDINCLNSDLTLSHEDNYYIRLLDRSGNLVAVAGLQPTGIAVSKNFSQWERLTDNSGTNYRQITLSLQTKERQNWGYLQVGRNLQDFEDYVATVKWILILGLPLAIFFIAAASWWLAGLAMQPIYQSYRQIQQFTADAAHELRTPLAAIRATVESTLMLPSLEPTTAQETLQAVNRQNQRLSQLVADLLILCRLERNSTVSSSLTLPQELVSLTDLVNDLAEEFASLALAAKLKLSAEIKVDRELQIKGDPEQLYCLVANLVSNAIRYTPADGEVKISLENSPNEVIIRVQDTGIGIAPKEQKMIFDRFYRVNSDRSRASGGSGLGLAIAAAIATTHQGSITVQSELNQGSTFTVKLPYKSANPGQKWTKLT